MTEPLWLHYLLLDVRKFCGFESRLNKVDQLNVLRLLLKFSVLAAEDFCLINAGTIDESETAKLVLYDALPIIEKGIIRFSMRENDFLILREKKEVQYRGTNNEYSFFSDHKLYTKLNEIAKISPRDHSIGLGIHNYLASELFRKRIISKVGEKDGENFIHEFFSASERALNSGLALTWPQIQKLTENMGRYSDIGLPTILTAYFEANFLSEKCSVLENIPFFEKASEIVTAKKPIEFSKFWHTLESMSLTTVFNDMSFESLSKFRNSVLHGKLFKILMDDQNQHMHFAVGSGDLLKLSRTNKQNLDLTKNSGFFEMDSISEAIEKRLLDNQANESFGIRNPALDSVLLKITNDLRNCKHYNRTVKKEVDKLLENILAFCRDRLESTKSDRGGRTEYLFSDNPTEANFQVDFHEFLKGNYLNSEITMETPGIASGRADVVVQMSSCRIIIECKRHFGEVTRETYHKHLQQAAAYQVGNINISFLGILEVYDRNNPPSSLSQNFEILNIQPNNECDPSLVICFKVPAKLKSPSALR